MKQILNYRSVMIILVAVCACLIIYRSYASYTLYVENNLLTRQVEALHTQHVTVPASDSLFLTRNIHDVVFNAIAVAAKQHGVIVKAVVPPVIIKEEGYDLLTEQVVLQGDFKTMMRCLDAADANLQHVKIASLKFYIADKKDEQLSLSIYFQTITPHENL